MLYVCFELHPEASMDDIWDRLAALCIELLYSIEEEDGRKYIYGYLPSDRHEESYEAAILEQIPEVKTIKPWVFEQVDWKKQWEEHGANFQEGFVHVELHEYGNNQSHALKLEPGPGFGDLSHPTTRLVLRMMNQLVKEKFVIDIGCGSGILALAAAALGADAVHGIDIDEDALKHAVHNARINELESKITFGLPADPFEIPKDKPLLVLMNMIQSEQVTAMESLPLLRGRPGEYITSGIMAGQEAVYLDLCQKWGWQLVDMQEEDGWLGFQFKL